MIGCGNLLCILNLPGILCRDAPLHRRAGAGRLYKMIPNINNVLKQIPEPKQKKGQSDPNEIAARSPLANVRNDVTRYTSITKGRTIGWRPVFSRIIPSI